MAVSRPTTAVLLALALPILSARAGAQLNVLAPREGQHLQAGQTVTVQARLGVVTGENPTYLTAVVADPQGLEELVRLRDDGTGADTVAQDGVWTGTYRAGLSPGAYRVKVKAAVGARVFWSRSVGFAMTARPIPAPETRRWPLVVLGAGCFVLGVMAAVMLRRRGLSAAERSVAEGVPRGRESGPLGTGLAEPGKEVASAEQAALGLSALEVAARPRERAPVPGEALVEMRGISIQLGEFAVREATLDVQAGEYFVLLGPTGAGKTVLLECIAGLHRPERGDICIAGQHVINVPPERRGLGYLPQDYALFPHLNVAQNIAFGMRLRKRPRAAITAKVNELAALLGITHLLHRSPLRLSGGERQRVALARALAIEPQVLLLDEPLSALDEQTREGLCVELRRVHAEMGTTTIHVSHNFEETLMVADRIGILHQGRVQQVGAPEEVFRRPASEFVARFVRSDNLLRGTARSRDGGLAVQVGELEFLAAEGVEGEVLLVVRPEEVQVDSERPAASWPNLVSGHVSRVVDRGPLMRVDVHAGLPAGRVEGLPAGSPAGRVAGRVEGLPGEADAKAGITLVALLPRPLFRARGLRSGDPAWAWFDPEAAYLLPVA